MKNLKHQRPSWQTNRQLVECGCAPCKVEQSIRAAKRRMLGWKLDALKAARTA